MSLSAIIDATADAVSANPANAHVVFGAEGRLTSGVATEVVTRQHSFLVDEPPSLGGADAAANPVEVALGALIACQVVVYRFWSERLGVTLDGVTIRAEGDLDVRGFFGLDDSVRPGFTAIRVHVELHGPEAPERYARLQAAVDAHCPVLDLVAHATPVTTSLAVALPV